MQHPMQQNMPQGRTLPTRTRRTTSLAWLGALLTMSVAACTDDSLAPDMAHPDLSMSQTPDLSNPPDLAAPALSARAQKGYMMAPFPIDTTGMTQAQMESIGIGSYLVAAGGCSGCHDQYLPDGTTKYLGGGLSFGKAYARNLTPEPTTGMFLTQAEFISTMATAQDYRNKGQSLAVMPFAAYRWFSTYDLQAIYAYLRVVPPVTNQVPADTKMTGPPTPVPATYDEGDVDRGAPPDDPVNDVLSEQRGLSLQPLADPAGLATWTPAQKAAFGRGSYLVTVIGCNDCHTNPDRNAMLQINTAQFLSGGKVFKENNAALKEVRTMAANLTGQMNGISYGAATFLQILRTNKHVNHPSMLPLGSPMPTSYQYLIDDDLNDMYAYISQVPRRTGANDKLTQSFARYCTTSTDCNTGETCNVPTHECLPPSCKTDGDCDACQTCSAGACAAPVATSTCLSSGI